MAVTYRPIGNTELMTAAADILADEVPRRIEQFFWTGFSAAADVLTLSWLVGATTEEFLTLVAGATSGTIRIPYKKWIPMGARDKAAKLVVTTMDHGALTVQFEDDPK